VAGILGKRAMGGGYADKQLKGGKKGESSYSERFSAAQRGTAVQRKSWGGGLSKI